MTMAQMDGQISFVNAATFVPGKTLKIHRVLDSLVMHGKTFYKVQFEDVWIDAEQLEHCRELIQKFKEQSFEAKTTTSISVTKDASMTHAHDVRDGKQQILLQSPDESSHARLKAKDSQSELPIFKGEQNLDSEDSERDSGIGRVVQTYAQAPVGSFRSRSLLNRDLGCTLPDKQAIDDKRSLLKSRREMLKCQYCQFEFVHRTHLRIHERVHTGEKPHKCNECGRSFAQKGNLHVHMKIHTGERKYVCQYCGKGFITSPQLFVHERTHFNPKTRPYSRRLEAPGYSLVHRHGPYPTGDYDLGGHHLVGDESDRLSGSDGGAGQVVATFEITNSSEPGVEVSERLLMAEHASARKERPHSIFHDKDGRSASSESFRNDALPKYSCHVSSPIHEPEPLVLILEESPPEPAGISPQEVIDSRHGPSMLASPMSKPHETIFERMGPGTQRNINACTSLVRPNELIKF